MHVSHDSKSASRISSGAGPNAPQLCCGLCRSDDRRAVRQRQRLPLSLDYLMFIERIPVPTRTPKLWHAMWWEAAATGRHAQSTTQVTTGNAFARLRTCQHRRHELFHLHPILCRLPLARHRSFSILTTQFDRLEHCAVKRPRRAVDAARGTVWTRRGAVTLLKHTFWRWRLFPQILRPVRVQRSHFLGRTSLSWRPPLSYPHGGAERDPEAGPLGSFDFDHSNVPWKSGGRGCRGVARAQQRDTRA